MVLRHNRPAARILGLVVLVVALGGIAIWIVSGHWGPGHDQNGLPTARVSLGDVNAHREAHLYYPGSREFSRFGSGDTTQASSKPDVAYAGGIATTGATTSALYLWYQRWMLAHGWRSHDYVGSTTWTSHEGFARGTREEFIVAVDDPQLLGGTINRRLPEARTVYEITYVILPAGQTQP